MPPRNKYGEYCEICKKWVPSGGGYYYGTTTLRAYTKYGDSYWRTVALVYCDPCQATKDWESDRAEKAQGGGEANANS